MKVKEYKRPIVAALHRRTSHGTELVWTRYYIRLTLAIPRAVQLALETGRPGDVVEFAHANLGFQIATVKVSVGASLKSITIALSDEILEARHG